VSGALSSKTAALKETVERHRGVVEQHRLVGFPLAAYRRFKDIEGKHLALIIGINVFVAVVPLLIVAYAFIQAFNPNRSIGTVLVGRFHLTGATAATVRATFTNAEAGKNVALSISVISLLVTGLDVAATVATAYARAFRVAAPRGAQKYVRGGIWLITLLLMTSVGLTVRYWASSRPSWFLVLVAPLLLSVTFGFYLATPRLVLDLPFGWRDLIPGAVVCTAVAAAINVASTYFVRNWFNFYGSAYGGFGVALALMSWIGIISVFWVWIAAAEGVYWERRAGSGAVLVMEQARASAPPALSVPSRTQG
jgi:uncharacterized BrkB/YihY/UPF0761 family membrane protein